MEKDFYRFCFFNEIKLNMIFTFFSLIACQNLQRPLICIHGFGGIQTDAELTGFVPTCNTDKKTIHIYELDKDIAQQYPDCISYFLETQIDSENHVFQNPNFTLKVPPFLSTEKRNPFTSLTGYFLDRKYTLNKDLIAFTYNWFLYPVGTPELFSQLQSLIEKAYQDSGKKVVLLGHSFGTHVIRQFILQGMTESWVKKHVEGAIFSAPAFFGCAGPFDFFVKGQFSSLPITNYSTRVTRKMPSIHAMFLNYVAFKDQVVFSDLSKYGNVTAPQVHDFFVKNGFLSEEANRMFNLVEGSLKQEPKELPIRSLVLYNSGMDAIVSYKGDNFEPIYGPGDQICQSSGPEYACKHWNNVECVDWKRVGDEWNHDNMLHRIQEIDKIYEFITKYDEEDDNKKTLLYILIAVSAFTVVLIIALVIVVVVLMKKNPNTSLNNSLISSA